MVECAGLEIRYTVLRIEGSNPSFSANKLRKAHDFHGLFCFCCSLVCHLVCHGMLASVRRFWISLNGLLAPKAWLFGCMLASSGFLHQAIIDDV